MVLHPTQVVAINGHDQNDVPVAAGTCVLRRSFSDIERVPTVGGPDVDGIVAMRTGEDSSGRRHPGHFGFGRGLTLGGR
ncbi:hypothetical protein GCM10007856_41050 [Azospirillum oryzae]|nr:hypothetical protein GCM10007856_41050 [Azospirillum oryzae]